MRFYLNMDMAGAIDPRISCSTNGRIWLRSLAAYREQMALSFGIGQSLNAHSDHYPFMVAGVPTGALAALMPNTGGRGYGHTMYDTVDKVERRGHARSGRSGGTPGTAHCQGKGVAGGAPFANGRAAILDSPDYRAEQEFNAQVKAFYGPKRADKERRR